MPVWGSNFRRGVLDRADAVGEIGAGMGGLAGDPETHEYAALAPGDDVAGDPAGFTVEDDAGAAGLRFYHGTALRAADFLVAGKQAYQRGRHTAEFGERGEHETVHHEAGFH